MHGVHQNIGAEPSAQDKSDQAQGPKGRDMGKSGVAVVCHGCFVEACPAPCHPSALLTGCEQVFFLSFLGFEDPT